MEDRIQYRHEYKFLLNALDVVAVRARLRAVMPRDPHAGPGGEYLIRSLYFDDAADNALREKLDGLSRRAKFRIRLYNHDDAFIRLEKKVKAAGLGTKISAPLTRLETERILAGDIAWMACDDRAPLRELYVRMHYEGLRPKTLVDYVREPFLYAPGNVRVTLDRDIRSGGSSTGLFSASVPMVPAAEGCAVMEVKFDSFLPRVIQDVIQMTDRGTGAFSKYAACRAITLY